MIGVYTAIKCVVVMLAILGYGMLWQRRRLPLCFFPITVVSGITTAVYLLGLAGFLKSACYAATALGLVCLALCFSRKGVRDFFSDWSILFVVAAAVWLYVITRGVMLSHYDDATHWYRICKAMHYEGAYPSTPDIYFYTYVPGCATWVYFLTRFIDFSIPNCLFAQNLLNIVSIAALFAAVNRRSKTKERAVQAIIVASAGVMLCCMNVSTYVLLVDAQVGLVAAAALIFALDCEQERGADLAIAMVLSLLALIKNSALLFVVLTLVICGLRHRFHFRRWLSCACLWVGVPALLFGLYSLRAGRVYGGTASAVQSLSFERFSQTWAQKGADVIVQTAKAFADQFFSVNTPGVIAAYACLALLMVLRIAMKQEGETEAANRLGLSVCMEVGLLMVYSAGLLAMYMFSMNAGEATSLTCFYRYFGTIVIVLAAMAVYDGLSQVSVVKAGRTYGYGMLLLFVLLTPGVFSRNYIRGVEDFAPPEDYRSSL